LQIRLLFERRFAKKEHRLLTFVSQKSVPLHPREVCWITVQSETELMGTIGIGF
jgi:hypothetical protein